MAEEALEFLRVHPYLFVNLFWVVIFLLGRVAGRDAWTISLVGGLFFMPVLPTYLLFEDSYWRPVRLGGGAIGIEDGLNHFILGANTTLQALLPFRKRIRMASPAVAALIRRGAVGTVPTGLFLLLRIVGVDVLGSCIGANVVIWLILLTVRTDLWRVAISGLLIAFPVYCLTMNLWYLLRPDFVSYWSAGSSWNRMVWGVPLGEIAWSSSFAPYGIFPAYSCDMQWDIRHSALKSMTSHSSDKSEPS